MKNIEGSLSRIKIFNLVRQLMKNPRPLDSLPIFFSTVFEMEIDLSAGLAQMKKLEGPLWNNHKEIEFILQGAAAGFTHAVIASGANFKAADGEGAGILHYMLFDYGSLAHYFSEEMLMQPSEEYSRVHSIFTMFIKDGGADPNLKTIEDKTPLHFATRLYAQALRKDPKLARFYRTFMQILACHGADPTIKDSEGRTPEDVGVRFLNASSKPHIEEVRNFFKLYCPGPTRQM